MKLIKLNCASCGAPISIPEDLDTLVCNSCGSTLKVDRGEGYIALKMVEKITQSIQETGEKTNTSIRENTSVTRVELKKVQISQLISTEELKISAFRQEIRELSRKNNLSSLEKNQLGTLHLDECDTLLKIRKYHMDMARLDEGWEDSLEVFRSDLKDLQSAIAALAPAAAVPQIVPRMQTLRIEELECVRKIAELERRLISAKLRSQSYSEIETLSVEQLDQLIIDIRQDISLVEGYEQSSVTRDFLDGLARKEMKLNSIYPRKKVESVVGILKSMDIRSPLPETQDDLAAMLGAAQADVKKVSALADSKEKRIVQNDLEELISNLKKRQDKFLHKEKTAKRSGKQKALVGFFIVLLAVLGFILIRQTSVSAGESKVSSISARNTQSALNTIKQKTLSSTGTDGSQSVNQDRYEFLEVSISNAYIRKEPEVNSQEIYTAIEGQIFDNGGSVEGEKGWYKVRIPKSDQTGYLYQDWVKLIHGRILNATQMPNQNGSTTYLEDFSGRQQNWIETTEKGNGYSRSLKWTDGAYRIFLQNDNPGYFFSVADVQTLKTNSLILADTMVRETDGNGYSGLMINYKGNKNFDCVIISTQGYIWLGAIREKSTIIYYSANPSIPIPVQWDPAAKNQVSVSIQPGNKKGSIIFTYGINGQAFYQLEYEGKQDYLPKIGTMVWVTDPDYKILVDFDNLEVRQ
jgi:hypothetical protein